MSKLNFMFCRVEHEKMFFFLYIELWCEEMSACRIAGSEDDVFISKLSLLDAHNGHKRNVNDTVIAIGNDVNRMNKMKDC